MDATMLLAIINVLIGIIVVLGGFILKNTLKRIGIVENDVKNLAANAIKFPEFRRCQDEHNEAIEKAHEHSRNIEGNLRTDIQNLRTDLKADMKTYSESTNTLIDTLIKSLN